MQFFIIRICINTKSENVVFIDPNEEKTIELIAPTRVKIPANIWHELTAITDIVFIELNSLSEGSEDTFRI